jgi:hypothetical protein
MAKLTDHVHRPILQISKITMNFHRQVCEGASRTSQDKIGR